MMSSRGFYTTTLSLVSLHISLDAPLEPLMVHSSSSFSQLLKVEMPQCPAVGSLFSFVYTHSLIPSHSHSLRCQYNLIILIRLFMGTCFQKSRPIHSQLHNLDVLHIFTHLNLKALYFSSQYVHISWWLFNPSGHVQAKSLIHFHLHFIIMSANCVAPLQNISRIQVLTSTFPLEIYSLNHHCFLSARLLQYFLTASTLAS